MAELATSPRAPTAQDTHALLHSQSNLRVVDFTRTGLTPQQLRHIEHKVLYVTALKPGSTSLILPAQAVSTHKERYFDLTGLPAEVSERLSSSAAARDFGGFENLAIESVFLMKSNSGPGKVSYSLEARFSPPGSLISEREGFISIPLKRKQYETLRPLTQSGNLTRQTTVHTTTISVNDEQIPAEYRIHTTRGFGNEKGTQQLSPSFVSKNMGIATVEIIFPEEHFVAARDLLLDSSLAPSFLKGAIPANIAREEGFILRRNAEIAPLSRNSFVKYHKKGRTLLENQADNQPILLSANDLTEQQANLIESEIAFVSVSGTKTPDDVLTVKRQALITQSYFEAKRPPLLAQSLLENSEELRLFGGSLLYLPIRNVRLRQTSYDDGQVTYSLDAKFRVPGLLEGQRIEISVPISEKHYSVLLRSARSGTVVKRRTMCEDTFDSAGQTYPIKVEVDRVIKAGRGKQTTTLSEGQLAVVEIEAPRGAFFDLRTNFLDEKGLPVYLSQDHMISVEALPDTERNVVSMRRLARDGLNPGQLENLSAHLRRHQTAEHTA